jgi:hypothetical protein
VPPVVLDLPYQVSIHGTPKRRRTADIWVVRRTLPVSVPSVDPRDTEKLVLRHRVQGVDGNHTCHIVDGRLFVPTGFTTETWSTGLVAPATSKQDFRPVPNPTSIIALDRKQKANERQRIVADEFIEILSSNEDEARAAAVIAGSGLIEVDGTIFTSHVEPIFARKKGWSKSSLHYARTDAKPSDLLATFDILKPCTPIDAAPSGEGLFGTSEFRSHLPHDLYARAAILTRCIDAIYPEARAATALIGDGKPSSSPIPDDLDDAVHGLRSLMREIDGPDGRDLLSGSEVSDALRRFVESVRIAGPVHVNPSRAVELRSLLSAAEAAAETFDIGRGPRP